MDKMSIWLQWQAQFNAAQPPQLQKIRDKLISQIEGQNIQQECNVLSNILNQIANDASFESFNKELLQQVLLASNSSMIKELGEISFKKNSAFGLKSSVIAEKWQQCRILSAQMTEEQRKKELSDPNSTISKLRAEAYSLLSKLNKIKGQYLESYLQALSHTFQGEAIGVAEQSAKNIVLDFVKQKIPNMVLTPEDTITQGQQSSTIDVIIGNEYLKTITSQNKVDVTIPSPFLNGTTWYASAKNYSNLRDIELLGKGSLIGLISQGFGPGKESKYVYNAFTIPESDWTSVNIHQLKQIFAAQALIGQKNSETKANVLVISINTNKNSIRAISTYALLEKMFNDTVIENGFKFNPILEATLPIGDGGARLNEPDKILNKMTISIALNRQVIMAKYIATLT